jgi:hypothetical protein
MMPPTRNAAVAFLIAVLLAGCGGTSSGPAMEHTIGVIYFAPEGGAEML